MILITYKLINITMATWKQHTLLNKNVLLAWRVNDKTTTSLICDVTRDQRPVTVHSSVSRGLMVPENAHIFHLVGVSVKSVV